MSLNHKKKSKTFVEAVLRDTLIKTGGDNNYGPNPSRFNKTTKNMILYKNLMFIFS